MKCATSSSHNGPKPKAEHPGKRQEWGQLKVHICLCMVQSEASCIERTKSGQTWSRSDTLSGDAFRTCGPFLGMSASCGSNQIRLVFVSSDPDSTPSQAAGSLTSRIAWKWQNKLRKSSTKFQQTSCSGVSFCRISSLLRTPQRQFEFRRR